jgi:hypothetical protein
MVERVYGRLSPSDLAARLASAMGVQPQVREDVPEANASDCITGASNPIKSAALFEPIAPIALANSAKAVPKGGIEPPTRGFSVLCSTN